MKFFKTITLLIFGFLTTTNAKLSVVASIPDIGNMIQEIAKNHVKLKVLATGREDLHAVPVRPSFLPILNRADLLFSLGLDAEHAWLPALAEESRNPKVFENGPGWIPVYKGIQILDVPKILDRSEGEQHPEGNPHFNIGPQTGPIMVKNILDALINSDPKNADFYTENAAIYLAKVNALIQELKTKGSVLKGLKIFSHHPDVSYLANFYGMKVLGSIEPKAGLAPTASHLRQLEQIASSKGVSLILYNQSQPGKIAKNLSKKTGAVAVQIANAVKAKASIQDWISLQRYNLQVILDALTRNQK